MTEARETACVLLVLSLANVPEEHKLHNAIIISYGQPNLTRITMMFRTLHVYTARLRMTWKIGMALWVCFHKNLLDKVDLIDALSFPYGYGLIKVDPLCHV